MVNEASGRCTVAVAPITDEEAESAQDVMRKRAAANLTASRTSPTANPAIGDTRPAEDGGFTSPYPGSHADNGGFTAQAEPTSAYASPDAGANGDGRSDTTRPVPSRNGAVVAAPTSDQGGTQPAFGRNGGGAFGDAPVMGGRANTAIGEEDRVSGLPAQSADRLATAPLANAGIRPPTVDEGEGGDEWDVPARGAERYPAGARGVYAARANREAQGGARTLTPDELRDLAERRGLSIEQLLADASARGISLGG
jgi:hypothetical protein